MKVALQMGEGQKSFIEFDAVPLSGEEGFRCSPTGTLSVDSAREIARELAAGQIKGRIDGYWWFRQAGAH
jgi:hypothetical protein